MKFMKKIAVLTALFMTSMIFAACDNENYTSDGGEITTSLIRETEATIEETTELTETEAVTEETASSNEILDREGNLITIPDEINTVISAASSITEILFGLGVGDKIISADMYSADVEGIDPSICTLDFYNLNVEQLIAYNPDVIIINGISQTGTADPYSDIKAAGINVIYIPASESIEAIKLDIQFLADYMGVSEKGMELNAAINDAISDVSTRVSDIPEKKSVYMEIGAAPYLYSCGSGTYLDEIISIAGGVNIYASETGWLSNSEETVIAANPDVIITNVNYDGYDFNEIKLRAGWNNINAIVNGNVYQVGANETSRASQNIVKGIYQIAKAIHPELYPDEQV